MLAILSKHKIANILNGFNLKMNHLTQRDRKQKSQRYFEEPAIVRMANLALQ